jgi:acetylornithine/succinyldiaminopimelate/putrescine aminotransferase
MAAVEEIARTRPNVVAVFLEVIQGEGGINPTRAEYLQSLRRLCDERGWLLMLDEVQCGLGRTGKWFAHQWAGIQADVMPLAKGLRATTAARSAATRSPCVPVSKRSESWKTMGFSKMRLPSAGCFAMRSPEGWRASADWSRSAARA